MRNKERFFQDLVNGHEQGVAARSLLKVLKCASYPYAAILALRALSYRYGLLRSRRLPVPVISVGNLVAGGTGKTPVTMLVAGHFVGKGKKVCVLSRGYGGSAEGKIAIVSDGTRMLLDAAVAGDEPCLLARKVPGLMVVIGADRYRAGLFAMEKLAPDLFILDDGFQHLRLERDLNILLLDAGRPLSNGYTLPGGLLREPPRAARRADVVLYTRASGTGTPNLFPEKPSFWTRHALTALVPLGGGASEGFETARGKTIAAFSGIANPWSFFTLLEASGIPPASTLSFPDHAQYGTEEVAAIKRMKAASGASILVTTEKDAVKLPLFREALAPCYAAQLEIECSERGAFLDLLEKVL